MAIRTYAPALSVTLTRLVNRTGGGQPVASTQPFKQIDLTPYLGLSGYVRTYKDINQPAGGFSITFADKMHPEFMDTVYALVEPMDLVEIRASRSPEKYQGTQLPLIMRGFVSSVDRAEAMSQEGTPERTVTVAGQDMGKLFLINRVYFEVFVVTDSDYLTTFHLFTNQGISVAVLPVNDFMHQLVENVINKKIEKMAAFGDTQLKPFTVEASVPDGCVIPEIAMQMDQFAIWQLAELFADRPWNEMFVVDQEDGPRFVFRPAPYRDLYTRELIMNGAKDPGTIEIDIADVVAMTMARSDTRVANLFIVDASASIMDSNGQLSTAALQAGIPTDFSYDGNKPELFGLKKMAAKSTLWGNNTTDPINKMPPSKQAQGLDDYKLWFLERTRDLKLMNRDNAAFTEGGAVIKGSEDILIGHYLRLTRGDVVSEAYITQVSHHFQPLQSWTTSIHTIRGDEYIKRNLMQSSPYLAENRKGPYS